MKKGHIKCDAALLDRFFDGELEPDKHALVSRHLKECPFCQKKLRENEVISTLFNAGVGEQLSQIRLSNLEENVVELIRRKKVPWFTICRGRQSISELPRWCSHQKESRTNFRACRAVMDKSSVLENYLR